ncbi:hypothetical protein CVT26_011006 [Gymnopilus dilepis]|uniref:Uncharacterized protein n=1 Tax=Gymnopilus dilepis TaxID=231916 RepID=A0A409VY88_9AGAR|nr:hypothetical protein CVT26_011006 [Gymnopilus dilepis]
MFHLTPSVNEAGTDVEHGVLRVLQDQDFCFAPPDIHPATFKELWNQPMVDLGPVDKVIPERRLWGVRCRVYLRRPQEMPHIRFGTTITYGQSLCHHTGDVRYMATENALAEDGISYVVFTAYDKFQGIFRVDHQKFHPIVVVALRELVHFARNPSSAVSARCMAVFLSLPPIEKDIQKPSTQVEEPAVEDAVQTHPDSRIVRSDVREVAQTQTDGAIIVFEVEVEEAVQTAGVQVVVSEVDGEDARVWYQVFAFFIVDFCRRFRLWIASLI